LDRPRRLANPQQQEKSPTPRKLIGARGEGKDNLSSYLEHLLLRSVEQPCEGSKEPPAPSRGDLLTATLEKHSRGGSQTEMQPWPWRLDATLTLTLPQGFGARAPVLKHRIARASPAMSRAKAEASFW